jgi:glutathione S-transferase
LIAALASTTGEVMKLIIGNKNYSSWSLRPWLLLSVHNIPFEEIRIPLDTPSTRTMIAKYNAAGRVPVLHDGGIVVWDSLAICEYVSERYLGGNGWPRDVEARALARSSCAEMHSGFPNLRAALPMNCRATGRSVPLTEEIQRDIARISSLWQDLREKYSPRGPWLFGEFSIVDCMFAPVIFRFRTYGISSTEICSEYQRQALANEQMQLWLRQSEAENEVIAADEAGR